MAHEGNGHLARQRALSDALGIAWRWWDAEAIRAALPGYDLARFAPPKRPDDPGFGHPTGGTLAGGVFWPEAGYVADPMRAAQEVWAAAARAGAVARRGAVAGVRADDRLRAVVLEDGAELPADVAVNAAGPASGRINALAGVTGDMGVTPRPLRQEVAHLPRPAGAVAGRGLVVSDGDIGVYMRPERDGLLLGSEEPPCDPMEWVEDADAVDPAPGDPWDALALRYGQRMPALGIPRRRAGVVACYDATEDFLPIYDRSALPGFFMACGTSGNQFKCALVAGRIMAVVVDHVDRGGDQDADPAVVTLPRTGLEVSTGVFSRRRRPNPESSGTVLG